MPERPVQERANGGACKVCGNPRPAGRTTYCSDECTATGYAQRTKERQQRRMEACKRCGGQKEVGTRGGRFCTECRRLHADTTQQLEQERSRRRYQQKVQDKLVEGRRLKHRRTDVPDGQKWCARCQEFRPVTSFPLRKEGGKPAAYCKPCQRFYNTERRIKLHFGLTWDEYELLLACQDGKCAICGGRPRRHLLAVDHDHKTGEIRGLLCSRCNHKLLGSANDDPARLRRAADYLEEFAPREVFGDPKYVPGSTPPESVGDAGYIREPEVARPTDEELDDCAFCAVRGVGPRRATGCPIHAEVARPVVAPYLPTAATPEGIALPGLEAAR